MNACSNCGKEIPEGRKFCCSSCSAKYNNVRRERKPWTEEQRLNVRKQRVCKYCGKVGKEVCDECRPYTQRVRTYTRLGFTEGSLKERNTNLLNLLQQMYFQEHLSLEEIWEKTGLRYHQVEIVFKSAGLELRNISEGVSNAILTGRLGVVGPLEKRGIRGYHTTWEGTKVWYRSSYELDFAKKLDDQKVPYSVEAKQTRTKYWDSELQRYRVAVPDFYLIETNEIIEVKSTYTLGSIQRMRDKFKAYREAGFIPRLWLNRKFVDLDTL